MEKALFAAGCFWKPEDHFRKVKGVNATAVGYCGGETANPSYEEVCTGRTGHAETVLVEYDPEVVSYRDLLAEFWKIHDPTQVNRQGPDVGTQYRSAIFPLNAEQAAAAEQSKAEVAAASRAPIATQVEAAKDFYMAEDYHQQYVEKHQRSRSFFR